MSEPGDDFRFLKRLSQEKRANNRANSAEILFSAGVAFTLHNNGAHLRIPNGAVVIDFWPGTGKWKVPNGPTGRGVHNLLHYLNEEQFEPDYNSIPLPEEPTC